LTKSKRNQDFQVIFTTHREWKCSVYVWWKTHFGGVGTRRRVNNPERAVQYTKPINWKTSSLRKMYLEVFQSPDQPKPRHSELGFIFGPRFIVSVSYEQHLHITLFI
jgi:hypothetical protein